MLRVISYNVNGIRAARRKGFFEWLDKQNADVVCLQEVRAQVEQLTEDIYFPKNYHCQYLAPERKGYSGVAIYSKIKPKKIIDKLNFMQADSEARYLAFDFGDLVVASIYLPSGSHNDERQEQKYIFMDEYYKILQKQIQSKKQYIICGDWNIAHKKIDIKNWRGNQKNSGFLPEERAWLDKLFDELGWVDAFRVLNQSADEYTWWSNRGRARENNVGWRIDYQIISPMLKDKIKAVEVFKDEFYSDHAPLIVDYKNIIE